MNPHAVQKHHPTEWRTINSTKCQYQYQPTFYVQLHNPLPPPNLPMMISSIEGTRLAVMAKLPLIPVSMTSYCPPWPPPHRKYWYSTNVDLNQPRSQYQFHMQPPDPSQYYQLYHMQHGEDMYSPTTADKCYLAPPPAPPTASEKNHL